MTGIDDPRASYWDETYRLYWEERVAESDTGSVSQVQKGDAKTEGDWVYELVFDTNPFKTGTVLDVGCAWGRMFPIYQSRGMRISGVDISTAMIEAARNTFDGVKDIERLEVSTAESLPFENQTFDNLVCVAVFDATYQHLALAEFLRVLKPGARVYLTGKSDTYARSDELAIAAEKGARGKGHPNYFTDVPKMQQGLIDAGCKNIMSYYFLRRGDFADFKHSQINDLPFYEWFLVFEAPKLPAHLNFEPFSSNYSKTYMQMRATS
jgi:ubiquinone/menaquinone biosynthesis C-methylase UbiE